MDDIRNGIFLQFHDVMNQNGHAGVCTLYRESLGEIVVQNATKNTNFLH